MDATLKCPKCSADIPLTDAFRKEIEAEVLAEEHARHAKELEEARTTAALVAAKRAEDEHASREAVLRAEAIEEKERNGRLLKQLEELTGEMRALKRKDEEREFAYKQQLAADEDRIRTETSRDCAVRPWRRSGRRAGSRSAPRSSLAKNLASAARAES